MSTVLCVVKVTVIRLSCRDTEEGVALLQHCLKCPWNHKEAPFPFQDVLYVFRFVFIILLGEAMCVLGPSKAIESVGCSGDVSAETQTVVLCKSNGGCYSLCQLARFWELLLLQS